MQPPGSRPLIIAHRGASLDQPENTLLAYQRAIEAGADGVECDVRLTRDGQLVCIHDRTLGRTSSGRGSVSSRSLRQLEDLDFGSWHDGSPAPVLSFRTLLELLRDADRPVRLLVETKHPARFGGRVEQRLIAELKRVGWADEPVRARADSPVVVMSFARTALRRVHHLAPSLPTVLLMEGSGGTRRVGLLPDQVDIAGPSLAILRSDATFVERARTLGNQVYVWTVDEATDVRYVADLGVDAIITNRPAEALITLSG
jgi:glycerophosphoryl diester phosphodiesterase